MCHPFFYGYKIYWIDLIVTIFFALVALLCHFAMTPHARFFTEKDPNLSFPYEVAWGVQEIPNLLIIILVVPIPIILLLSWYFFWKIVMKLKPEDHRVLDPILGIFAFIQAMVMTFALTEFTKNFVGRKRPNFFAMCNYMGYRDALASGNFTQYNLDTVLGQVGSMENCYETDPSILSDSQYSFPSGHSSSAFCALIFCGLVGMNTLVHWSRKHNMTKAVLVGICIWSAAIIASTRPRDYWHNFDDVLAGAAIGTVMAMFVFYLNFVLAFWEEDTDEKDKDDSFFKTNLDNSVMYPLSKDYPKTYHY